MKARWNNWPSGGDCYYSPIKIDDQFLHAENNMQLIYNSRWELRGSDAYVSFYTTHKISNGKVTFYLQRPNGSPSFYCSINDTQVVTYPACTVNHYQFTEEKTFDFISPSIATFKVKNTGSGSWGVMADGVDINVYDTFKADLSNGGNETNGVWLSSNNICFTGVGDLSIEVTSLSYMSSSIKYYNSTQNQISKEINSQIETITISPDNYYYEPLSDGTYRITLNLTNVQISDAKMVDTGTVFEYLPIRLPEMSRSVDFTKSISNKPEYNNSLISALSLNKLSYNSETGHWTTTQSSYPYSEIYNNSILGDFYFLIEDIGTISPEIRFFNRSRGPNTFSGVKCEIYNLGGLHRRYQDYDDTRRVEMASFDWPNAHLGGHIKYWHTGFTYPVNTALYYGADGTTLNKYQWQVIGSTVGSDSNASCERVTTNACEKLKQDWGNNLRIYVIKYRKQSGYKHKISGNKTFNYSYIDQCASDNQYIYDVSNESNLQSALQTIANDIKAFSGYQSTQNVN